MARNEMVDYFIHLKGNPKACIVTEPLWYIPYTLFSPFATLFMSNLGVTDTQIGYLLTAGMIVQVFAAFFGGIITDKLGRRMTTLITDTIAWSIPCFIWAFSQNFWWFLAASMLNGILQVSNISWSSLMVEDCEPSRLVYAFSWIQIAGVLSVFFAPVSYLLMERFDMVLVVRCLYLFSFASMTAKFVLLFLMSHETGQGVKRMEETRHIPVRKMIAGYKDVFLKLIRSRRMVMSLFIMLSFNITSTVSATFFGLYTTKSLGIDEGLLAIFSMVGSITPLIIMFTLQNKLNRLHYRPVMILGYVLFIVNNILLISAPPEKQEFIYLYSIINAVAVACISPRNDSLAARFVDKEERSRVMAIMYMVMIGITSPFGTLIGVLSDVNRAYPFVLAILFFAVTLAVVACSKEIKKLDSQE